MNSLVNPSCQVELGFNNLDASSICLTEKCEAGKFYVMGECKGNF